MCVSVNESHYYLFQFECLHRTRWVLFYLTFVLLSFSQSLWEYTKTHTYAPCTHCTLFYRLFRRWYLFYSRNRFCGCYFCAYIQLFFFTNSCLFCCMDYTMELNYRGNLAKISWTVTPESNAFKENQRHAVAYQNTH